MRFIKFSLGVLLICLLAFGFYSYNDGKLGSIHEELDRFNREYSTTLDPNERILLEKTFHSGNDNPWVAKFKDNKIYKSEVEEKLVEIMGPSILQEDPFQEMSTNTLENLIKNMVVHRMIVEEARKTDIEHRSAFKIKLEKAKNELIQKEYINDVMRNAVREAAIKEEYENFTKQISGKTEYHLRHILTTTKENAGQAYKELLKGEPFNEIALKHSIDITKEKGGELGWMLEDQIPDEIVRAVSQLKHNSFSEPVESKYGWHVVYLTEKRAAEVPELSDMRASIEDKLGQDAVQNYINKLVDRAQIVYNIR